MTVNITLLTKDAIYQAADLRLTDPASGAIVTESSTKIVNIVYFDWSGFVTYTGVGQWRDKDTGQWVCDWLRGLEKATPGEIADRLRTAGDGWLGDIERQTGQRHHHTFVFSFFSAESPETYVISNFEDVSGRARPDADDHLGVTAVMLRRRPKVVVTGQKRSVSRVQKWALGRIAARHPGDQNLMRIKLEEAVAAAHRSPHSRGFVGKESTVVSLRADGSGFQEASGKGLIQVHTIMNGFVLSDVIDIVQLAGPNARICGTAFSSTRASKEVPPCSPKVDAASGGEGIELRELPHDEYVTTAALAVNGSGVILGVGTVPGARGDYRLTLWAPDRSITDLGLVCRNNLGCALNDDGKVAATIAVKNTNRAVLWDSGDVFDLGVHLGVDSGVRCINASGAVGGWVCIHESQRGQDNFRPARWDSRRQLEVLENIPVDWGQVVDLDDHGAALLLGYKGRTPVSLVWESDGRCIQVGDGIYPNAFLQDGHILGWIRNAGGQRVAVAADRNGGGVTSLDVPPDWHVVTTNKDGDIVGYADVDGYERAWLCMSDSTPEILPNFHYHHSRPTDINRRGDIVGRSRADRCEHASLWDVGVRHGTAPEEQP